METDNICIFFVFSACWQKVVVVGVICGKCESALVDILSCYNSLPIETKSGLKG